MELIDFANVGGVRCVLLDKNGKRIDSVRVNTRMAAAPYPLPQKVLREVYALVNMKRDYLSRQEELSK